METIFWLIFFSIVIYFLSIYDALEVPRIGTRVYVYFNTVMSTLITTINTDMMAFFIEGKFISYILNTHL